MGLTNANRYTIYRASDCEFVIRQKIYFTNDPLDAGRGLLHKAINVLQGDIVTAVWLDVVDACPENATVDIGYGSVPNYWGNGVVLDTAGPVGNILTASDVWGFDQLQGMGRGGGDSIEIEVAGATWGDHVSVIPSDEVLGMLLTGNVIHPNRVEVTMTNITDDKVLNPDKMTFTVVVNKAPLAGVPWMVQSADTIDVKATTDLEDVDINSGAIDVFAKIIRPGRWSG